jgi:hypothetical protein
MKTIIAAAIAFMALASFAVADEMDHHHRHPVKVCSFEHHHRVCHMSRH